MVDWLPESPKYQLPLRRFTTSCTYAKLSIETLAITYRCTIVRTQLCIINDRSVYFESTTISSNHICRIAVLFSLKRVIFDAYPTAGRIGGTTFCIE